MLLVILVCILICMHMYMDVTLLDYLSLFVCVCDIIVSIIHYSIFIWKCNTYTLRGTKCRIELETCTFDLLFICAHYFGCNWQKLCLSSKSIYNWNQLCCMHNAHMGCNHIANNKHPGIFRWITDSERQKIHIKRIEESKSTLTGMA